MNQLSLLAVRWRTRLLIVALTGLTLALTRWPLAPKYLYYFDSVNFALALDHFDPAQHQPQPPGYPLFVLFTRLLHLFVTSPERVFLLAGILAGALAVILLWVLGEKWFTPRVGFAAALLLLFNPAFWFSGITNQVRIFLAVGGVGVAAAAWRACRRGASPGWFYATAALLGVAGGFRPAALLFLFPMLVTAGLAGKRPVRQWAAAAAIFIFSVWVWLGFTVARSGGLLSYFELLRAYASDQFQSSLVFGASAPSAWRLASTALIWNGLGVITWIWALPLVRRSALSRLRRRETLLLAVWFVPPFLFHAFVHVGDPDHTLITVPVLCLTGAWVLAGVGQRWGGRAWLGALLLAVALNAVLFFRPLPGLARASSYRAVASTDRIVSSTLKAIADLSADGPVTLVSYRSFVTWRHLEYYFPNAPLLVLNQDAGSSVDPEAVWLVRNERMESPRIVVNRIVLPGHGKIVWVLPVGMDVSGLLDSPAAVKRHGPLNYIEATPNLRLRFGAYNFMAGEEDSFRISASALRNAPRLSRR